MSTGKSDRVKHNSRRPTQRNKTVLYSRHVQSGGVNWMLESSPKARK